MEERKIENRGGKRERAGRPAGSNTTSMHLRLKNSLLEYVNSKPNKNGFINDCIEKEMLREQAERQGKE